MLFSPAASLTSTRGHVTNGAKRPTAITSARILRPPSLCAGPRSVGGERDRRATARAAAGNNGDADASSSSPSAAAAAAVAAAVAADDEASGGAGPSAAAAAAGAAAAAEPAWSWDASADATAAYGALLALVLAGKLLLGPAAAASSSGGGAAQQWLDLPYFIGLAAATVYVGAHRGLTTRQRQQISLKQGAFAPLVASGALFGVYLAIKFFPQIDLKAVLSAYFFLLTGGAALSATVPTLRRLGGTGTGGGGGVGEGSGGGGGSSNSSSNINITSGLGSPTIAIPLPDGLLLDDRGEAVREARVAPTDALAAALALTLAWGGAATWSQPLTAGPSVVDYSLNNLAACLIAADILQLVGLRSFRAAALLLCGLLAYDVVWVFASPLFAPGGENVMLEVATSDAVIGPTRLLFPRAGPATAEAALREGASFPFSLLGLGDVAVPGLLACLALRFDATRAVDMPRRAAAAVAAMRAALAEIDPAAATAEELGAAGGRAAAEAYDRVADAEEEGRRRQQEDGAGGGGASGALEDEAAAAPDASSSALAAVVVAPSETVLQQRPYFTAVLGAHAAGLLLAFYANSVTGLGQPALLYIVPATLGAVALTALSRGEIGRVWAFTDVPSFGPAQALIEKERSGREQQR